MPRQPLLNMTGLGAKDGRKLFPLLRGEGQGEGEFDNQLHRYA